MSDSFGADPIREFVAKHNPAIRWMAGRLGISERTLYRILAGQGRVKSKTWKAFEALRRRSKIIPTAQWFIRANKGNRKLTIRQVRHIRKVCNKRGMGMKLAEKYGVAPGTISNIITRRTWRHI